MTLPQTNLQLYRLLVEQGRSCEALAIVRASYDAACRLFSGALRPTHKPFTAHLVGTAAALAIWGESTDLVTAGMLHSAYLYGMFDDGLRGAAPSRRRWLRKLVGVEAESLVARYTESVLRKATAARLATEDRDVAAILLADLYEELSDGGVEYSPKKRQELSARHNENVQQAVVGLVRNVFSPAAADDFARVLRELGTARPPECLQTADASSSVLRPGIPALRRSALSRRFVRLGGLWNNRGAA